MPHCPFCHENLIKPFPKACPICGNSLNGQNIIELKVSDGDALTISSSTFEAETFQLPEQLPPLSSNELDTIWSDTNTKDSDPDVTIKKETKTVTDIDSTHPFTVKSRELKHSHEIKSEQADYELIKILGEGGMGVVYKAKQTTIDREIAIKMIKDKYSSSESIRNKFLVEAAVTGDLDHPNIVPIHELGTDNVGHLFFSMKMVKGTEWKEVISAKSRSENLEILMRVADAVAYAHSRGVIHRDLKPENIMLGDFGEVLVMDWGLAASVTSEGKADSVKDVGLGGTPPYMAPEMASGNLESSYRSDVYLLGAILYEILSGKKPHMGKNIKECLSNAAQNIIQPIEEKGELVKVSFKAMSTDPENRFATVKEFQDSIREYQSHAESVLLSEEADHALYAAAKSKSYADYARAMFTFEQSLKLWDNNGAALNGVSVARLAYANCAFQKGDFSQASSLLREARLLSTPLGKLVITAKAEQEERVKRVRGLRKIAIGLAVLIIFILSGAFIWVLDKEEKAFAAGEKAVAAKNDALKAQKKTLIALEEVKKEKKITELARDTATIESEKAKEERKRSEAVSLFMTEMLAQADPNENGGKNITLLNVMEQMSKVVKEKFKDDDRTRWRLQSSIGQVFMGLGKYDEASLHIKDAELLAIKVFGKKHKNYASSLHDLAGLYWAQAFYAKAGPLFRRALAIRKTVLGEDHPEIALSMNRVAVLYSRRGRKLAAEKLFLEARDITIKAFGLNHPNYATSLNYLASLYKSMKQYSKAESLILKAMEIQKKSFGAIHPKHANSLDNLASLYLMQSKYAQAEKLLLKSMEIRKETLGVSHPDFALSLNTLSSIYAYKKDFVKAESFLLKGVKVLKNSFDEAHPKYFNSLIRLASLYNRQEKYAQAESINVQIVENRKKYLGADHYGYAASLNNLAIVYKMQKKYSEAEKNIVEAMGIQKAALGINHFRFAFSLNNLADLYGRQGYYTKAEPLFLESIKIRKKVFGVAHPVFTESLNGLIINYKNHLASLKSSVGENHLDYKNTKMKYDDLVKEINDHIDGEDNLEKTLKTAKEFYSRGKYLLNVKKFISAKENFEKVLKLDPLFKSDEIYLLLGQVADGQKNGAGKISVYKRWVNASPNSADALYNYAMELLTCKNPFLIDPDVAMIHAEKAAKISNEKDHKVLIILAMAYFECDKIPDAIKIQEKAIALLPNKMDDKNFEMYMKKLKEYKKSLQK
ncbi:MAG: hypothetical protein COA79_06670 [Planctomycetota bacterium]|nr:MAG: hypothetical protein COA79_06670 [Planctomycetota bacterium]